MSSIARGRYQTWPDPSPVEYEGLKADVLRRGKFTTAIDVDEDGNILDGHTRERIENEPEVVARGIKCPREVHVGLTEQEKRDHSRRANTVRRKPTPDQVRAVAKEAAREDRELARAEGRPERSARDLAAAISVDHKTIVSVREELDAEECPTGDAPQLDTPKTIGADGKARPATAEARAAQTARIDAMIEAGANDSEIARETRASRQTVFDRRRKVCGKDRIDYTRLDAWLHEMGFAPKPEGLTLIERGDALTMALGSKSADEGKRAFGKRCKEFRETLGAEIGVPVAEIELLMRVAGRIGPEARSILAGSGFDDVKIALMAIERLQDDPAQQRLSAQRLLDGYVTPKGLWNELTGKGCRVSRRSSNAKKGEQTSQSRAGYAEWHNQKLQEEQARKDAAKRGEASSDIRATDEQRMELLANQFAYGFTDRQRLILVALVVKMMDQDDETAEILSAIERKMNHEDQ